MSKIKDTFSRLHPCKELPKESALWSIVAIILMGFALWIVFTANWQTEGFYKAGYKDGKLIEAIEVFRACRFTIVPHVTSILCAILIYGALLARRYVRLGNLYALFLLVMDVFFIAALVESFIPADSVCLVRMLGWEVLTFSPLKLLVFAILLSWLGMRALSGFSIILLLLAFWSRTQELDVALGFWGGAFLVCGIFSFVIQFCKLPYMIPDGGFRGALSQDFGWAKTQIRQNMVAAVEATGNVAAAAASIASPAVMSKVKSVVGQEQKTAQIQEV